MIYAKYVVRAKVRTISCGCMVRKVICDTSAYRVQPASFAECVSTSFVQCPGGIQSNAAAMLCHYS